MSMGWMLPPKEAPMPKVKLTQRHTASFDASVHYVPPPGRGVVSRPISLRVAPEFGDALEALLHARPEGKDEPYFPHALYRSLSDLHRACLFQGYLYFRDILKHQDLDRESDVLVSAQRSAASAKRMEVVRHTAEELDNSLRQYAAAEAWDEAKALWSEQKAYVDKLDGYAHKILGAALMKHQHLAPKVGGVGKVRKR